jgi:hypothetical protein
VSTPFQGGILIGTWTLLSILFISNGWADCGSIPFYAPVLLNMVVDSPSEAPGSERTTRHDSTRIDFDPLNVTVFEPKQRALILWNGKEEILLLSTDQRASQRSAVLEVIPLPAEPKVNLGDFETFEAAQKLVIDKRMWVMAHAGAPAGSISIPEKAGKITFQKKLGAHDLAVAKVLDKSGFTGFVQKYLQDHYQTNEAPIRPDFLEIIQSYVDSGYRWFAFDVITLDEKNLQSREPIEYRFASDHVYYPLRISGLESGKTEVELLVFSEHAANHFMGLSLDRLSLEQPLPVTADEVERLNTQWAGFFGKTGKLTLNQWRVSEESAKLDRDILVR